MIEQTQFLSTVLLGRELKSENIYSGVNFCGKNVCGNSYLRELIFADRWKTAKFRTSKNFVPHGKTSLTFHMSFVAVSVV